MNGNRGDSWCGKLSETNRWRVYNRHAHSKAWRECAEWAVEELEVEMPSQSSYYRFRKRMAGHESEHRIELAITEKARIGREMDAIGEINLELKRAFEQRALESELRGDNKGAGKWVKLALALGEAMNRKIELQLKQEKQSVDENRLKLEREKFRETVKSGVEKAIDALYEECRSNAVALKAWQRLKKTVLQEVEAAA